jgi:hypothetical protein
VQAQVPLPVQPLLLAQPQGLLQVQELVQVPVQYQTPSHQTVLQVLQDR